MDNRVTNVEASRLFLAAVPDADTAARIHRLAGVLKRAHKFMGKLIPPGRLHVSLFFLGGLHEDGVRKVCEAAAETTAPPFHVSFDRTSSFGGRAGNHPLVLFGGVMVNSNRLGKHSPQAMMRKGLRRWANTNFTPHVTLLYGERRVEECPVVPLGWTVKEFVLVHSIHGHIHLARWPLCGR